MTNEEILKFQKRARYVAAKRGYPELADDFAQEIFIAFARGWHATVEQLFSSYLRDEHGDPRTICGSERRRAKARTISLDAPIGEEEDGTNYHDLIGYSDAEPGNLEGNRRIPFALTTAQAVLYELYFIEGYNQSEIARHRGITQARIWQLLRLIKLELEHQQILSECWERYLDEPGFSEFLVDWITL
jgi:DNA-directed RNA polymerase specialized sigma24 family protein